MIDATIQRIPLQHRFAGLYVLFSLIGVAAIAAAAYLGTTNVIVQTHTRVVKQTWGTPDQTVPAEQVSPALAQAGLTVCDVYQSRRSVVCH